MFMILTIESSTFRRNVRAILPFSFLFSSYPSLFSQFIYRRNNSITGCSSLSVFNVSFPFLRCASYRFLPSCPDYRHGHESVVPYRFFV